MGPVPGSALPSRMKESFCHVASVSVLFPHSLSQILLPSCEGINPDRQSLPASQYFSSNGNTTLPPNGSPCSSPFPQRISVTSLRQQPEHHTTPSWLSLPSPPNSRRVIYMALYNLCPTSRPSLLTSGPSLGPSRHPEHASLGPSSSPAPFGSGFLRPPWPKATLALSTLCFHPTQDISQPGPRHTLLVIRFIITFPC